MSSFSASHNTLLGPASFYKRALSIAFPVMGQLLIQNLVSLIDNFMVAGLGDVKMSGVNIAGQITFVFMIFLNTVCMSGGIFMSQYNGAQDPAGMQQAFRFKIATGVVSSFVFMVLALSIPGRILALMVHGNSQRNEILSEGVSYIRILSFSFVPMLISMAIGSSLREIGSVRAPLIISVVATLVNTFCNWILIYGKLGAPRLEVQGAAYATIIARCTEMLLFFLYIRKTRPPFYSRLGELLKIRIQLFFSILKKSGLILVSEMSWVLSETVVAALYNSRGGADVVSGMAAGFAIANLFFVCFSGIFTVTGVILGGTLGANKLAEAKCQKNWLLSGSVLFGLFAGILGCLTVFIIPVVFSNLSETARIVTRMLVLVTAAYMPAWTFVNAQFAISRTGGDTTMGVVVDVTVNTLLVVPGMFALTVLTPMGPVAMYGTIKLTDLIKIIMAAIWLKKERWLKNLTIQEEHI